MDVTMCQDRNVKGPSRHPEQQVSNEDSRDKKHALAVKACNRQKLLEAMARFWWRLSSADDSLHVEMKVSVAPEGFGRSKESQKASTKGESADRRGIRWIMQNPKV